MCSDTAEQALERLVELRRAARDIAERRTGYRVAAAGSYPTSIPSEQEIAPVERYRDFVEYAGPAARRQGVSGLHVHIGMPDAETCFRVDGDDPALAAGRARALRELAVLRGARYRDAVDPRGGARLPAAQRCTAGVPRLRGVGAFHRADGGDAGWRTTTRASGGTFARIRASERSRFARPTRRPRSSARVPRRRWCTRSARGQSTRRRGRSSPASVASTSRTAGLPRASDRTASSFIPTATKRSPSLRSARELPVPLHGLDPETCEADRQLEVGRARRLHAVCADLVERSVA